MSTHQVLEAKCISINMEKESKESKLTTDLPNETNP